MRDLTAAQFRAFQWLAPCVWWRPSLAMARGLRSLAKHHPDLCETIVRAGCRGPEMLFRLTREGEALKRTWHDDVRPPPGR